MVPQKAEVFFNGKPAGLLAKANNKYFFKYNEDYLKDDKNPPVSLTLPKKKEMYLSDVLFPFFYGLLAEGENKNIQYRILNIHEDDYFTRLIKTAGKDTIGGITLKETE